ncbi:AfsR/SARP family transcriptional regulator [Kitasatospora terrestris]|uniref:OmpR/PhoB-type domain-containing protein n=1 Tax=Kitasatospora terrestris TaxID=258051 RepID=A0ABP9DZQ8_9ACTN
MTVLSDLPAPAATAAGPAGPEQHRTTRLGLLGPLRLCRQGTEIAVPAPKHRALLALLAINANRPVQVDRIIGELWQDREPKTARKTLQGYVWRLRTLLGPGALHTTGNGYELRAAADAIDAVRFGMLAERGRAELLAGRPEQAARLLRPALGLWRGPALADVPVAPGAYAYASRLEEERLTATEWLIEAELALGRHAEAVPVLRELVVGQPLREGLRAQLMLALFRSGRQAEALAEYGELRALLREEQGLDPGRAVSELQARILAGDAGLENG